VLGAAPEGVGELPELDPPLGETLALALALGETPALDLAFALDLALALALGETLAMDRVMNWASLPARGA
jgi:hypothetical protein